MGRVYHYQSEYGNKNSNLDSAEKYYMKSLELKRQLYNSGHSLIARVLTNIGNVYMIQKSIRKLCNNAAEARDKNKDIWGKCLESWTELS